MLSLRLVLLAICLVAVLPAAASHAAVPAFAPADGYAVGATPVSMATGDLDEDGDLDLVTADLLDSTVSVLLNDGAGGFAAAVAHPTGGDPDLGGGR